MDGQRFDALTRALAAGASRRRVLQALGGGAVSGLLGLFGGGGVEAATCADRCSRLPAGTSRDNCLDVCTAATQGDTSADAARAYAQALRDCRGDTSRLCGSGTGITCCATDETCNDGVCGAGGTPCPEGQVQCASGCADVSSDPDNCGQCGLHCATNVANAHAVCGGGQCGFACDGDFNLCDNTCCPADHVCQDGTCSCPAGACGCSDGLTMCPDGCADLMNDPKNCGGCSIECALGEQPVDPNAIAACSMGHCGFVCASGFDVCGLGCCPTEMLCVNGMCVCPSGQADCGNGCADVTADPDNCGQCGLHCVTNVANAHPVCRDGECSGYACNDGFVPCGDTCVAADEAPANCATCGAGCSPDAPSCCDGLCVDTSIDAQNCGACGQVCDTTNGRVCTGGSCRCPDGTAECGDRCSDLSIDLNNCGACGHACGAGQICRNGQCLTPCDNFSNCPDGCTCSYTVVNENGTVVDGPTLCVTNASGTGRRCTHGAACPAGEVCVPTETQPNYCAALCRA